MPEQRISIYDPSADAFREVSVENAVKAVRAAKDIEAKLVEMGISLEAEEAPMDEQPVE